MLIVTRRTNETVVIGDNEITITVLGIKGGQVRVGIDAPRSISVHRKEIFLKAKKEDVGDIKPLQLNEYGTQHC